MKDFFFDYIYYRLAHYYFKWDGKFAITAVFGVSMIQIFTGIDIIIFILRLSYTREDLAPYSKTLGYILMAIGLVIVAFNYFKYRIKYNIFRKRWKHETHFERKRKGMLVVICLILPLIPLIIMGIV